jgi:two-component system C4-dicarboxylate transport sensor histidine kinase DctB
LESLHAFALRFHAVDGLLLLGPRTRNDTFSEEQLAALSLLFDQFAATLHNRVEELARVRAERKAMQQEKLSVLGLLAGSLAHELRNPLSSMRTIASLLVEDLGPADDRTTDVRMIISEIDRLNQTTQRLLEFSRPSDDQILAVAPDAVLRRLAGILGHLARQWHVTLDVELDAANIRISATDASFSEICFNLIRNAIEAVRGSQSPRVQVTSQLLGAQFVVTISDNGPGIDPAMRESIFQPFVTGKSDGTGLGLYIVSERVAELNGRIQCRSGRDQGTSFEVSLPVAI